MSLLIWNCSRQCSFPGVRSVRSQCLWWVMALHCLLNTSGVIYSMIFIVCLVVCGWDIRPCCCLLAGSKPIGCLVLEPSKIKKNKWKNGLWLLDCTREASQITRVQGHALRQTIRMPTELFNWVPGGKNTTGAKKSRWFGRLGILRVLQHVPRQRPSRPVPVLFGECHGSLAGFSSLTQEWYSQACVRKCKGSDKLGLVEQPANRTPF